MADKYGRRTKREEALATFNELAEVQWYGCTVTYCERTFIFAKENLSFSRSSDVADTIKRDARRLKRDQIMHLLLVVLDEIQHQ